MSLMLQLYPQEFVNRFNKNFSVPSPKSIYNNFEKFNINRKYFLDDKIKTKVENRQTIYEEELNILLNQLKNENKVSRDYTLINLAKDCKIYFVKSTKEENYYANYRSKERAGVVISKIIEGVKKYLIVKGNLGEGKWSFPKGHLDHPEERLEIGASRELLEETGIVISSDFVATLPRRKISRCTYFYLDCNIHNTDISEDLNNYKTSDTYEVAAKEWKSLNEIKELLINYDMKKYFGLNK